MAKDGVLLILKHEHLIIHGHSVRSITTGSPIDFERTINHKQYLGKEAMIRGL
jgi:hypothetical protein